MTHTCIVWSENNNRLPRIFEAKKRRGCTIAETRREQYKNIYNITGIMKIFAFSALATNRTPRVIGPKILIRAPGLPNLRDQFVSQHHSDTNDLAGLIE